MTDETSEPKKSAREEFHVYKLLGVIVGVTVLLALIAFTLQVTFLGLDYP